MISEQELCVESEENMELSWDRPGVLGEVVWTKKFRFKKDNGKEGAVGFICIADLVDGRKIQFIYRKRSFGFGVHVGFLCMVRENGTVDIYTTRQLWITTISKYTVKNKG
jgi:hypothetical protein